MKSIAALFSVLAVSVLPISASADFYRYYDEVGNINVTNDYKSIPDRYRKSVTVTTERQLEKKVKARERQVRIDNASRSLNFESV